PCSAASSAVHLASNCITHVLSIGSTPSPKVDGVVYRRLGLKDDGSASLELTVNTAAEIIKEALKGSGRVLVHCSAGISRSPTVVTAYLMKEKGMGLKEALGVVVRARPQVSPNSGFLRQLKDMEMDLWGVESLVEDEIPRREVERLALFAEPRGSQEQVNFLL
ncbi:phosphatases II, partial [Coprinopsis marcescibilis]